LVLLPLFVLPRGWLGRRLQASWRERYDLERRHDTVMVERFNVAGACW